MTLQEEYELRLHAESRAWYAYNNFIKAHPEKKPNKKTKLIVLDMLSQYFYNSWIEQQDKK